MTMPFWLRLMALVPFVALCPAGGHAQPLPGARSTVPSAAAPTLPGNALPTAGAASTAPAIAPGAGASNLLEQAARSIGMRRCESAVAGVASRALQGTQKHDIVVDWNRADPDGGPFFSVTGLQYPTVSALLSLSVVPLANRACGILIERISSAPIACKEVAHSELAQYHATPLVRAVTVYTLPARPRETVILVDTPQSCLIVRRQADFSWPAATTSP
ncbi:hypothetical protein ACS0Y7_33535 [Burkholderia gladioli]|uniref:hypothetical protein n=1 Tax=Burkholderia gladioli TaxID=28095 RepID=UPI003F78B07C